MEREQAQNSPRLQQLRTRSMMFTREVTTGQANHSICVQSAGGADLATQRKLRYDVRVGRPCLLMKSRMLSTLTCLDATWSSTKPAKLPPRKVTLVRAMCRSSSGCSGGTQHLCPDFLSLSKNASSK